MASSVQPLVHQLYRVYSYIKSVNGVAYDEIGALLNAVGDGLDYTVLNNGLDVLVSTGLLAKHDTGYDTVVESVDIDDFRTNITSGLGFNESKLVAETFDAEGIKDISLDGDVEFWKAYVPAANRHLLPYLEGLNLLSFDASGRIIKIGRNSVIAQFIVDAIRKSSKRRKSLETLLKELEEKRKIGAIAETLAMAYERRRLGYTKEPELVSNDYVNAGYDIVSFMGEESKTFDRYIEVKAVGTSAGFYLSRNELEQAREHGDGYYLYLVDVTKSTPNNPIVNQVENPAEVLFGERSDWIHTVESYRFMRIGTGEIEGRDDAILDPSTSE